MTGEEFEVEDVGALTGEPLEQSGFADAGEAGQHVELALSAERLQIDAHLAAVRPPTAFEHGRFPADLAHDEGEAARALAAAPAIDERLPVSWLERAPSLQMNGNVGGDEGGSKPSSGKSILGVESADLNSFGVVQDGQVDGSGHVILGKFGG